MRRYIIFFFTLLVFFTIVFVAVNAMNIEFLQKIDHMWEWTLPVAAVVGTTLLVADILLPVPSSLIMVANGTLFGFWAGTLISMGGGLGAAMIGYLLGRSGSKGVERFVKEEEMVRARAWFAKWGNLSVTVSRPIPLISETLSIAAGASGMKPGKMLLSSILGVLPAAAIYAWTGAYAREADYSTAAFLLVVGLAGTAFFIGKLVEKMSCKVQT